MEPNPSEAPMRAGVGRCELRTGSLGYPVMPIRDGFIGCFVPLDGAVETGWDRQGPALPFDEHEHVAGAGFFGSHTSDFDLFSFEEGRNRLDGDTLGLERESDFVLQVVIPAHGLLLRSIGIHDGFVLDSGLSHGVPFGFGHGSHPQCYGWRSCRTREKRSNSSAPNTGLSGHGSSSASSSRSSISPSGSLGARNLVRSRRSR